MLEIWENRFRAVKPLAAGDFLIAEGRLRSQTRPVGSLGYLEEVVSRYVAIRGGDAVAGRKRVLIFAGDHGIEREGVSLYPREVTLAMVQNFLNGGATVNAAARQVGAEVYVFDVGVDGDCPKHPHLGSTKIRRGTRNSLEEPAMTVQELSQALEIGWNSVERAAQDGVQFLALGEMGIANTTAASAIVAALMKCSPSFVTGRGTGLDEASLARKVQVIERILQKHTGQIEDPFSVLRCLGGYEIAALAGAVLSACHYRIPTLVDGWIVTAAVLICARLNPAILDYLIFAHCSDEKGHQFVLKELGVRPLLQLSMRLGEASGAVLAMGLVDTGLRIYREVATFAEAGVAESRQ
ncbi:MAG: nicotinate-nucleotide--dimethylbenzimidazole phosphoribosyltransferase [Candidatus Omnitrophota bacterium]|nr:nicotinate-nucleotide--dimethylbenzimidazole phosphoribosyltransferase [Candidatus Omnitrophota bacterium]